MAQEQEEIIIIQDEDTALSESAQMDDLTEEDAEDAANKKKKKMILIAGGGAVIILLLVIIALLLYKKLSHNGDANPLSLIEKKIHNKSKPTIEQSELEKIIAKANYLYANGNKQEALNLFEQIALYSEGVSQYNLGVAQLKDKQYDKALEAFKKAIQNNEKVCVSAINAAVCAQALNEDESFKYYIGLAYASRQMR